MSPEDTYLLMAQAARQDGLWRNEGPQTFDRSPSSNALGGHVLHTVHIRNYPAPLLGHLNQQPRP